MIIHQLNVSKIITTRVERSLWKKVSFFLCCWAVSALSRAQLLVFHKKKKLPPKKKDDKEAVFCQNVEEGYSRGKPLCFNGDS